MGANGSHKFVDRKVIIRLKDRVCENSEELFASTLFREVVYREVARLKKRESPLLGVFGKTPQGDKPADEVEDADVARLIEVLKVLSKLELVCVLPLVPEAGSFVNDPYLLNAFVENLYNAWREYERFVVVDSADDTLDQRPYRTFNATIETLMHLVRKVYRDIQRNTTGRRPPVYRQVQAGAEVAAIALPKPLALPGGAYDKLREVPVIRQILMYPPLLLNPPMNKRTGQFERVRQNPLDLVDLRPEEWLCYPARVGPLLILVYFHERFFELGFSLCNLLELADDRALEGPVDAVYMYGVPGSGLDSMARMPTVFFEDTANDLLAAAAPNRDEFGYFGYLKKMVLTLHNIKMLRMGRLPFHGAMVHIALRGGKSLTVLIFGDTGAGKSETLEAFRTMGEDRIAEMVTIADDMGSLEIGGDGAIRGYGTEVGAFVRLDDLQPGYAFGQLDRTIIMNPNQVNARVILPVTTYENVIRGYRPDMVLYANNYEQVDADHPLIERLPSPDAALSVWRDGAAMSKGTTTATGLVHTYFVNIFGATQYRSDHDAIATRYFDEFYRQGIFVGQFRTRLGIPGWERKGPEEAARALLATLTAPVAEATGSQVKAGWKPAEVGARNGLPIGSPFSRCVSRVRARQRPRAR
jgi:hypothetical protein